MDNGEEIPLLNDSWTFMGVKLNEWIMGFMVMMLTIAISGAKAPSVMPIVVVMGVSVALGAATLRRRFPDEERGVRNFFMVFMGFCPPGIPAPSSMQPFWSGGRIRKLRDSTRYMELGLDELFVNDDEDELGDQRKDA